VLLPVTYFEDIIMAIITLSNSGTYDIARGFLWEFGDVGDDDKFTGDNLLQEALYTTTNIVSGVHRGLASEDKTGLVGTPTITASKIAFRTTSFSSDDEDIVADLTIKGSKLVPSSDQAKATSVAVNYTSSRYQSGQAHTTANLEQAERGFFTNKLSYDIAPWGNSTDGDAAALLTEQSTSNRSTKYEVTNGSTVKYDNAFSRTIKGNITLTDDFNFGGYFTSIAQSYINTGDDGSEKGSKLSLTSKAGLALDDTTPSVIDRLTYSSYNKTNSNAHSFTSSGPDAELAGALGQFLNSEFSVSDVAAVMFAGNDKITSSKGNNTLNGYGGNDTLIGGKGDDLFQFTAPLSATNNVDRIQNFKKSGNDKIQLSADIFAGLRGPEDFVIGAAATSGNASIIYNNKTGTLSYDSDGTGTAAAVPFAILVGKVTLDAMDFALI